MTRRTLREFTALHEAPGYARARRDLADATRRSVDATERPIVAPDQRPPDPAVEAEGAAMRERARAVLAQVAEDLKRLEQEEDHHGRHHKN